MNIKPITPAQVDINYNGPLLDDLIHFINESIAIQNWHSQIVYKFGENYFAILIPLNKTNIALLDKCVAKFKEAGWDCLHSSCYDARGPHHCFYVHKSHFSQKA